MEKSSGKGDRRQEGEKGPFKCYVMRWGGGRSMVQRY